MVWGEENEVYFHLIPLFLWPRHREILFLCLVVLELWRVALETHHVRVRYCSHRRWTISLESIFIKPFVLFSPGESICLLFLTYIWHLLTCPSISCLDFWRSLLTSKTTVRTMCFATQYVYIVFKIPLNVITTELKDSAIYK